MGCHANITATTFPKQGAMPGKRVRVCFHYATNDCVVGLVVRDDIEAPHLTIIQLGNGRYVIGTECQYAESP